MFKLQQEESFQNMLSQKLKKVHKIEETESDYEEYSDHKLFVDTTSIQDPFNTNEIKNKNSAW